MFAKARLEMALIQVITISYVPLRTSMTFTLWTCNIGCTGMDAHYNPFGKAHGGPNDANRLVLRNYRHKITRVQMEKTEPVLTS